MVDINFFSRPENIKKNVDVNAVLILDNYSSHNIDMSNVFPSLKNQFLTS